MSTGSIQDSEFSHQKTPKKEIRDQKSEKKQSASISVAAENEPANKLYRICGFELASQIENHGIVSNIYVIALD
jgi:hypothetical protein